MPDQFRFAVLDLGGIDTDDSALFIGAGAFLAVAGVDLAVGADNRGHVDDDAGKGVAPDFLAGANLESVPGAVGTAGDEQALAVDDGNHGRGIISAANLAGESCPPDDLAGLLVEGDVAVHAAGLVAPTGVQHADDDAGRRRRSAKPAGRRSRRFDRIPRVSERCQRTLPVLPSKHIKSPWVPWA